MPEAWSLVRSTSPYMCIHGRFEEQAAQTPTALAVADATSTLTYQALNAQANQLAHVLQAHGVGPDSRVALCIERSVSFIVAALAALKAGGAYVPLDPALPKARLRFLLNDSRATVLLTQETLLEQLPSEADLPIVCLDRAAAAIAAAPTTTPASPVTPDHLAYLIYTSGSTGTPKGVAVSHAQLANLIDWHQHAFAVEPSDRASQIAGLGFDAAVWEVWPYLLLGASVICPDAITHADLPRLIDWLAAERITISFLPTPLAEAALTMPWPETMRLRVLLTGGDRLQRHPPATLPCILVNNYGPTENTVVATSTVVLPDDRGVPSIGRPITNTEVYLLNAQMQPVGTGLVGEVYIGGASVARGYWQRPDLTAERFVPDPFSGVAGARLYRTGDLARYREDGQLDYLGRVDEQVKVRGYRIELGEIEALLLEHPSVRQAVVTTHAEQSDMKRLVAYVVPQTADADVAELGETLRTFMGQHLPQYMVPSAVMLLDAFPLTPNGKIDRRALPTPDFSRTGKDELVHPRTPAEALVAEIWADVLGISPIGIHDNFFAIGGHSLLAAQVLVRLREVFQLSIQMLFEHPTVAGLVAAISADLGSAEITEKIALMYRERLALGSASATQLTPARPASGHMPLSFAQQRLWLIERLDPGNLSYLVPQALRLTGPLNVAALEQSCNEVVRRHEALRTVFRLVDDQPVQIVQPEVDIPLLMVDLEALDPADQALSVQQLSALETQRPFDLSSGPLLRTTLLRLNAEDHVLLLTIHHIVVDDWSLSIFCDELAALYAAHLTGQPAQLTKLTMQYPDVALWQRAWLQGAVLEEQSAYWQRQLQGCASVLHLPTDRPRPAAQTFCGARETIVLPPALSQALADLSQREGVTLFMTLLATFQVLLHRYSNQSNFVVGTPIANRRRREFEDLIGFFVNTLALRADLSGNPSFCDVLGRVREMTLGAYAHQDLPFEQVVELVQPERDPSHNPLFQVMFALQNSRRGTIHLDGLTVELVSNGSVTAQFDLFLEMIQVQDGLITSFEYNTDLFDAATIVRMMGHLQMLLEAIIANPQQRLADLPLLTAAEHELIATWNATDAAYPQNACLHQLFESQVARTPNAIAVIADDGQLTYQELDRRANQLAHHLQKLGVGPEVRVGICVERNLMMVVGLLGILKAGGAYIPLDPAYPEERLLFMLHDSQVPVLVTQQHLTQALPEHDARLVCLDTDWLEIAQESTVRPRSSSSADHLAYIIYTSGSTGKPKGVQIEHKAVVNFLSSMQQQPGLTEQDVLLSVTTLSFDIAGLELFLPLSIGARMILVSREVAVDGTQLAAALRNTGATVMQATPATWRLLIEAGWEDAAGLKVLCGGEALPHELARQILDRGATLWNLYGPTETTIWSAAAEVKHNDTIAIGWPIANTQLYLLDARFNPVPIGVHGELYIGGDGLSRGYLHRPGLTAERFVPNPFSATPGARLYHTGDVARYLPDGRIEYLGRIDHQVKVRGYRIELGEIETVIGAHPAVQETVVMAREDVPGDQRLVAYMVPNPHYQVTEEILAESQSEHISDWQQLYDDMYRQPGAQTDETFDIAIWNSSYTGMPIPAEEMQEQVDQVVARVLAHQPQRVLELGCGTGLLLFRIAPFCTEYWATDFSATVLEALDTQVKRRNLAQVRLLQRVADDLSGIDTELFDVVLINSVVQYFPSTDYLLQVLKQAVQHVRPGGCIMVGDIRSYPLLEAYHTSVQVFQTEPMTSTEQLCQRIQSRVTSEEELVIAPTFFRALQQQMPCISQVEVQLRRGRAENELTKFRYDVMLYVEREVTQVVAQPLDWQRDGLNLESVQEILTTSGPDVLLVRQVPNARLWREVETLRLLASEERPATVGDLTRAVQQYAGDRVDPEALWTLGAALGYTTEVGWSQRGEAGLLDVTFRRSPVLYGTNEVAAVSVQPWHTYANNPVHAKAARKLVPQVRSFLLEKMPEYMVPSAFVVLEALPLTPNGKVDRKALPAPTRVKQDTRRTFVAPRTALEAQLAGLWAELFGVESVGIDEDFFALGGHSLLAIRLTAQIKTIFGVDLPLRDLFHIPTVAGCAQAVKAAQQLTSDNDDTLDLLVDLIADTTLDLAIRPTASDDWFTADPKALFLTGTTGFLGAFMLHELLQVTNADLYCLVRAKTSAEGKQRIRATLEEYGLWDEQRGARIMPVLGDLAQVRLGLSEEAFAAIANKVDGVYHSAAMVSFIYPYAALRAANVQGTHEVLRLAAQGKIKPLHYISTIAVANTATPSADGRVYEDTQLGPIDSVDNGYVQTKWVAEHLVLAAKERGLPVSIYRPGRISGHTVTGASNPDDLTSRLITGWAQLGSAPNIEMEQNLAPIDYVSQAIVHLSLQRDTIGQIFHLLNPQSIKFSELVQAVNTAGFPVQALPYDEWYASLFATVQAEQDNVLFPLLPFLAALPTEESWVNLISQPEFDCQNTINGLANSTIMCPAFSADQVRSSLAYFIERGLLQLDRHPMVEQMVETCA